MPPRFEDAMLKKFILALQNHKTVESIQLMNYLMNRKTPRPIDLTHEQYDNQLLGDPDNVKSDPTDNKVDQMLIIKQRVKSDLRSIFIQHGALDYEIALVSPI
jgi:hypothetical protein